MAAKEQKTTRVRPKTGFLTKVAIVVLLVAIGWKLYDLQGQMKVAQEELDRYAIAVSQLQQENEALEKDIQEGATPEKLEEIAREELGLVAPGEYVFYDTSN